MQIWYTKYISLSKYTHNLIYRIFGAKMSWSIQVSHS